MFAGAVNVTRIVRHFYTHLICPAALLLTTCYRCVIFRSITAWNDHADSPCRICVVQLRS